MEDGINKINIGFLPWLNDESFLAKNKCIEKNIRIGDAISLMLTNTGGTSIRHNNQLIGMLSIGTLTYPPNGLTGYIVTNVLRFTYEDCVAYDIRLPKSSFSNNWNAGATRLGYVNIVDFAGYGR